MMDSETMDRELSHLRHRVGELEGRIVGMEREVRAIRETPDHQYEEKWTEAAGKIAKWAGWPDDMELELDDVTNNPMVSIDLWFGDDEHGGIEVLDERGNYRPVKSLHDVIRERERATDFVVKLWEILPKGPHNAADDFFMATATPAQRTAALLKVIEEE